MFSLEPTIITVVEYQSVEIVKVLLKSDIIHVYTYRCVHGVKAWCF